MVEISVQLTGVSCTASVGCVTPDKILPPHKRSARESLYRRNPHCYWCGMATVFLREKPIRDADTATVDHLYSKLHPRRKTDRRIVLACYGCNNERSKAEARRQIFIPKLKKRRRKARQASAVPFF